MNELDILGFRVVMDLDRSVEIAELYSRHSTYNVAVSLKTSDICLLDLWLDF